tara:strand:+ start:60 stop:656 length:597 start_codon:yes stop_codon:yes gene_type:complete
MSNIETINNNYSKLNFIETELRSPMSGSGLFKIYINKEKNILYKKIKSRYRKIYEDKIEKYKKIIYDLKNNEVLSEFIFKHNKILIENDGSYYCSYIINGIRLWDINLNSKINCIILNKIKNSVLEMKEKLNNYVKTKKLNGDWSLHNLIYCLDSDKIYNIDLEGFYTYPYMKDDGNCDIKHCNNRFDTLLKIINKLI